MSGRQKRDAQCQVETAVAPMAVGNLPLDAKKKDTIQNNLIQQYLNHGGLV